MTDYHHFEYPPPRSWEQFEELCADLFEAQWSDPGLVRNGRAGQAQHGVDIVARQGGLYPVGLQCKKKAKWPVKNLTETEIDDEVEKAKGFRPLLEEFFLLTTAQDDVSLQKHVRELNVKHKAAGIFRVVLLGWSEIVRRVTRHEVVARKHFAGFGAAALLSPLLATWYTRDGVLSTDEVSWELSVKEAAADFFDWPGGHVVVRQHETDALNQNLQGLLGSQKSTELRRRRIELRRNLERMLVKEREVEHIVKVLLTNESCRFYLLDLWDKDCDLPLAIRTIIEDAYRIDFRSSHPQKIRLAPPSPQRLPKPWSANSVAAADIGVDVPADVFHEIWEVEQKFAEKYGNPMVEVVGELPSSIRAKYAIPAIIWRVLRIQKEERRSLADLEDAGYLSFTQWKFTLS